MTKMKKTKRRSPKDDVTAPELVQLALLLELNDRVAGQQIGGNDFYFRRARDLVTEAAQYLDNNQSP